MIQELWNFAITLMSMVGYVWDWLNTEHFFGFKVWLLELGFYWKPIWLLGGGILTLFAFLLVKNLVPVA